MLGIILALFLGIALLLYGGFSWTMTKKIIAPKRADYGEVQGKEMLANRLNGKLLDLKYDKVFWVNPRGQELVGRMYSCQPETNRYVLFNHGYNYPWIGALKYIPMFLEKGFNVFVPDYQAEGESQGKYITFGYWECQDSIGWLDEIEKHALLNGFDHAEIGVMGESMGGVVALMMASQLNSRLKFCISDCPFSNWDSIIKYCCKTVYRFPAEPFLPLVRVFVKWLSGADMKQVDTKKAAPSIKIPTLIIHGSADKFVPATMSREIIDENPSIQYFIQEGAGHGSSITTDETAYRQTVYQFLKRVYLTDEYFSQEGIEWQML